MPQRPNTFYAKFPTVPTLTPYLSLYRFALGVSLLDPALLGTAKALPPAMSVYPNPATGQLSLTIQGSRAPGAMQATLMNCLGQVLYTKAVRDNSTTRIDVSQFTAGMYLLKVSSSAGSTSQKVIIR